MIDRLGGLGVSATLRILRRMEAAVSRAEHDGSGSRDAFAFAIVEGFNFAASWGGEWLQRRNGSRRMPGWGYRLQQTARNNKRNSRKCHESGRWRWTS